jgi:hypothetical protein
VQEGGERRVIAPEDERDERSDSMKKGSRNYTEWERGQQQDRNIADVALPRGTPRTLYSTRKGEILLPLLPRHGSEDVQRLLFERQDRLTWRQWQVGMLSDDDHFLLKPRRIGYVLGIQEQTVRKVRAGVTMVAYEFYCYRGLVRLRRRAESAKEWKIQLRGLDPTYQSIWETFRAKNRAKKGRTDGPPRPWLPDGYRLLWQMCEEAGLVAYEDGGARSGIAWKRAKGRGVESMRLPSTAASDFMETFPYDKHPGGTVGDSQQTPDE